MFAGSAGLPSPIRPLGRASIARLYPIVLRERAPQVEEVRIERRAPELALFLERFAQVVRERLDVDRWDARFPLQHGHLLHVRLMRRATPGQEPFATRRQRTN